MVTFSSAKLEVWRLLGEGFSVGSEVARFEFRGLFIISLSFCFAKWWICMYWSRDAAMLIGRVEGFSARCGPLDLLMRKFLKREAGGWPTFNFTYCKDTVMRVQALGTQKRRLKKL